MATPSEKLAESLELLKALQDQHKIAIQAKDLSRTHRERLLKGGFLQEVIKGWYIFSRPNEPAGDSTTWYTSYWSFCAAYLNKRFGEAWCLSSEQSLSLHAGNWRVPRQLLIHSPKGRNKITPLPHNTSLFDARYAMPEEEEITILNGMRVFSVASALVSCAQGFYIQNSTDVRAVLCMITDASEILRVLLKGGHSTIASRLVGAFRNVGRERIADEISKTMRSAGYEIREIDPFESKPIIRFSELVRSPYVNRLRVMWQQMRLIIIENFPSPPRAPANIDAYLERIEASYVTDAYHSLSIEGYRVSPELIERVRSGGWNPLDEENDRNHKDALAARGYWQAFQLVKASIRKVLSGANSGKVFDEDHRDWYREMFGPSVTAGILQPHDLAGYRNAPVYIRRSMHVPPSPEAVRDMMPAFCELLREETEASVRIVLGHFVFGYIHPYMDGNGRMARFTMNIMLASGAYPWVVVPVTQREKYMAALEEASINQNIKPLCDFISVLLSEQPPLLEFR